MRPAVALGELHDPPEASVVFRDVGFHRSLTILRRAEDHTGVVAVEWAGATRCGVAVATHRSRVHQRAVLLHSDRRAKEDEPVVHDLDATGLPTAWK